MIDFNEREKGFEAKFKHDQDLEFKIRSLRNKLLGEWAAKKINIVNIQEYVIEVRQSDLIKPGDDDIIEKLLKDFEENNIELSKENLTIKISELENIARKEILSKSDV